jgi:hypothetical protein
MVAHGRYRYRLWRRWLPGAATVAWVMLNPSTADDLRDDPTIRRCIGLSRGWGFGGLEIVNLYALRATDPADLFAARRPVGAGNDAAVAAAVATADAVFAAWGNHGRPDRVAAIVPLLGARVYSLGTTAQGAPRHPLYVASSTRPVRYAATPATRR